MSEKWKVKKKGGGHGAWKKKSIKKTLLSSIIGLSVSISIIFGLVNGVLFYRDANRNIEERLNECSIAYSQSVQNAIKVYQTSIESIARNTSITDQSKSVEERQKIMNQLAADYGFNSLSTAGSDGKTTKGSDASQREYFKQAIAGNTYISSTLVSSVTGETLLIVSSKINNGEYDGVVVTSLASDTFSNMIDDVSVGKSGYGFIVDKDGKIIAHKNRETVDKQTNYIEMAKTDSQYKGVAGVIQKMTEGKTGIQTEKLKGQKLTTAYRPIPGTDGWSVGIVAKQSELMSGFYQSIGITAALTIVLIVISFLLAFRIATPIVNPVVSLVKRIEALEEGDLHSEVPQLNTGNELETLSKSFTNTIKTLNNYIQEIGLILASLEKGDCTVSTSQDYKGDFIHMKESLTGIIYNLNTVFAIIKESANQVAGGAQQISDGAQALATGTTEQAATVEELNASVTSVSHQAEQNAASAEKAAEYVKQATEGMNEGNQYMQKLDVSMKEIGESSVKISNISKVIEDIAFQTNILALNAAVESARAGEAGKGFAVVADEVRNLAAKSGEAAKQTADLIQQTVDTISSGEKLADETAAILRVAAEKAGFVEQAIQEITASSVEQVQAIEQIEQGLSQVSTVVQTNAATAEESSASSEELAAQAEKLNQEVVKFKLRKVEQKEQKTTISDDQEENTIEEDINKY